MYEWQKIPSDMSQKTSINVERNNMLLKDGKRSKD